MKLSFPEKPQAWNKKSLRRPSLVLLSSSWDIPFIPSELQSNTEFCWVDSELHMATVSDPGTRPKDDTSSLLLYFFTIWLLKSENLMLCNLLSAQCHVVLTLCMLQCWAAKLFSCSTLKYWSHKFDRKAILFYHVIATSHLLHLCQCFQACRHFVESRWLFCFFLISWEIWAEIRDQVKPVWLGQDSSH